MTFVEYLELHGSNLTATKSIVPYASSSNKDIFWLYLLAHSFEYSKMKLFRCNLIAYFIWNDSIFSQCVVEEAFPMEMENTAKLMFCIGP